MIEAFVIDIPVEASYALISPSLLQHDGDSAEASI